MVRPKVLPMTAEEKFVHWLEKAQYDLKAAKAMLKSGFWLYVAFMCQQAIEKLAKGLYTLYVNDNVPRIHQINAIFDVFRDKLPAGIPDEKNDLFDVLSAYYMNNRYPEFKESLGKEMNKSKATDIFSRTKDAFEWLLTLKP